MQNASQNIFIELFFWYFIRAPKTIFSAWKNFLLFNIHYFSILELLKSLFSPWKKYQWSYGRGFDIKRYLKVFFSNLMSRFLGSLMRFAVIIIGLLCEIFILIGGLIIIVGWIFLPAISIAGIVFGFKVLQ